VGEATPETTGDVGFDYEKFSNRLIPEWREKADRLLATNMGGEVLTNPDFRHFVTWNSWEINQVSQLIENGLVDPMQLSDTETSILYYMHTSLIDMSGRVPTLEIIAQAAANNLGNFETTNPPKALIKKRKLASIYEELSLITSDEEAVEYAMLALEFNLEAGELNLEEDQTPLLDIATSPRKVHARFSMFDIGMRSLTFGPHIEAEHQSLSEESRAEKALALQLEYYKQLSETISDAEELEDQGTEGVSGSFGALLVLGRLRDRLISRGKLSEIEASNSFIRQDHTYHGNSSNPPDWKYAFDLKLKNHGTGSELAIEVKKLKVGSSVNGSPNKYLPIIEVVQFRLGTTKQEYFEIAKDYCDGRVAELSGDEVTFAQAEAIRMFEEKIDPELDRVFARLDNPNEVATNYSKERRLKPRTRF